MFVCPNWIMIGAASRNVGKTEFACALIRQHLAEQTVIGVKVTTVKPDEGPCPRGGEGCGVCNLHGQAYCIIEEKESGGEKDSNRMLRAGARTVLWLRVMRQHLAEGIGELLKLIPLDALVVCESNTARTALEPGVFLVVREAGLSAIKGSCQAVLHHADRVVEFCGDGWDFQPEQLAVAGDRWVIRPAATAVILAGGESRRMGVDKSLLEIDGQPMIARIADQLAYFPERIVGANDPGKYDFLQLEVVPDQKAGQGPLMGILSCVQRAAYEICFVTACDIPQLDPRYVLHLVSQAEGCDIVMPRFGNGRVEPLLAVYRKTVVPVARSILERGGRRIVELFDHLTVRFVSGEDMGWYRNLNTEEEVQRWREGRKPEGPGGAGGL
ncbi:MAG: molybdenum cofactor guanylyltransferase [Bradymonadales bacterium]|nr:molybdenum cofactor guanylyltransferase [Bradymonadales bacterium]